MDNKGICKAAAVFCSQLPQFVWIPHNIPAIRSRYLAFAVTARPFFI